MAIPKIKIGQTELESYPFVLGGNVFAWTADEKTSFAILDKYLAQGFNTIDTAAMYSVWVPGHRGGESESIIGKWLKSRKNRDKIILSTKVAAELNTTQEGLSKAYIVTSIDASLQRLQTDYIDLYFTHYDDLKTPVEEIISTYADLIQAGKIRYIGASNMSALRIEASILASKNNNLPAYSVLQPEYNLYDRQHYESEYLPLVEKYGLGVLTYYSLASGFLTGKYQSKNDIEGSHRIDKLAPYFDERGLKILAILRQIAQEKNATPAQIALAWLIHQKSVTAPIASVSKPEQLDILKAVNIEFTPDELSALNKQYT